MTRSRPAGAGATEPTSPGVADRDGHGGLVESVSRHQGLLGTVIDVRVLAGEAVAPRVADVVVEEIGRLESVFSVFDPTSDLNRWKRDELGHQPEELVEVMTAALCWQRRSHGAFNPMVGLISAAWRRGADTGVRPSPAGVAALAASIAEPRFDVQRGEIVRTGDCTALDVNAIAKGYIVDRAARRAVRRYEPHMIVVGAGGDLLHRGAPPARIGIEDPLRPYDNEPPLAVVELSNAGLATSGGARRGFRIGDEWFGHVIDPRTGEPVGAQASISVVAPDAMTADVMATVLGLSEPATAVREADTIDDVGCLVVDPDGGRWVDVTWRSRFGPAT